MTAPKLEAQLHAEETRCPCGNLLARWTTHGLELKCRRCKRLVYIPYPHRGPPFPQEP